MCISPLQDLNISSKIENMIYTLTAKILDVHLTQAISKLKLLLVYKLHLITSGGQKAYGS